MLKEIPSLSRRDLRKGGGSSHSSFTYTMDVKDPGRKNHFVEVYPAAVPPLRGQVVEYQLPMIVSVMK